MRKALIVGIDYYTNISCLSGCVKDAISVRDVLERHANGTINFATPRLITGTESSGIVKRHEMREAIRELFSDDAEIALMYFAGHGHVDDTGGFICAGDCTTGDDGVSLTELMTIASESAAKNKVIILDSCHSGVIGSRPDHSGVAEIGDGMTILTASTEKQYAEEAPEGAGGIFTTLFVDALSGAAANLLGDVTPGSVYAHIDQSLGPWKQRPVFKTNVKTFVSLRTTVPPIPLKDLQALAKHFPTPGYKFKLDPAYEPERSDDQRKTSEFPPPDPEKNSIFEVLQRYVKVNLVRPVDAPHMWHAAMQSKACELTVLGEHYRKLVEHGLI